FAQAQSITWRNLFRRLRALTRPVVTNPCSNPYAAGTALTTSSFFEHRESCRPYGNSMKLGRDGTRVSSSTSWYIGLGGLVQSRAPWRFGRFPPLHRSQKLPRNSIT